MTPASRARTERLTVAIEVSGDRADRHSRLRGDSGDGRLVLRHAPIIGGADVGFPDGDNGDQETEVPEGTGDSTEKRRNVESGTTWVGKAQRAALSRLAASSSFKTFAASVAFVSPFSPCYRPFPPSISVSSTSLSHSEQQLDDELVEPLVGKAALCERGAIERARLSASAAAVLYVGSGASPIESRSSARIA